MFGKLSGRVRTERSELWNNGLMLQSDNTSANSALLCKVKTSRSSQIPPCITDLYGAIFSCSPKQVDAKRDQFFNGVKGAGANGGVPTQPGGKCRNLYRSVWIQWFPTLKATTGNCT